MILVVDDEPLVARAVARELDKLDEPSVIASTVDAAVVVVRKGAVSAAILDFHLDGDIGELVSRLVENRIPFLFFTGSAQEAQQAYPDVVVVEKGDAAQACRALDQIRVT